MTITTLDKQSCFYYNISGFSTERDIQSEWIILSYDHILSYPILEKIYIRNQTIELLDFLGFDFDLWPSEIVLLCHSESLYLTSYLSSIDIFLPYRTVLKIFDFKALKVFDLDL